MYRTFVILRHTFRESVVQPIYPLLLAIGAAILVIFGRLPFFTLGEDTIMFKSVALDMILLLILISTLFAASKSIYEEIEDRTMLTLMSKPLHRWEVIVGKYLGIILAALVAVAVLGLVLVLATYLRIPEDYQLSANTIDDLDRQRLYNYRLMHVSGLVPALVLRWLQICVLAAVSVAVSTRVSLVVNLPIVILVYVAGNLTRFLYPIEGQSFVSKAVAVVASTVLPYLEIFDLNRSTIYRTIAVGLFKNQPAAVNLAEVWTYVAMAGAYALVYAFLALASGLYLFGSRDLGGAEG